MSATDLAGAGIAQLQRLGLSWRESSGQCSLRGLLLGLARDIDQALLILAEVWGAEEERHPASLPAERLQRVDYLNSFPHQATFAVGLEPDDANLDDFRSGPIVGPDGQVALTRLAAVREILTPAACYHLYTAHEDELLARPLYLTTRNVCFRRESYYQPLRRQGSFTMREIVCLGTRHEAAEFLEQARSAADLLLRQIGIPVQWETATDPFFRPLENPQYLMQRLQPTKQEALYRGDLAIGSANLHHEHFGEGFTISRDGEPAHTACAAFGIERWLFAITAEHGTDPAAWPDPVAAARQVAAKVAADRPR